MIYLKKIFNLCTCFVGTIILVACNSQNVDSHYINSNRYNLNEHSYMMPVFRNHFHQIPNEYAQHPGIAENALTTEEMQDLAKNIITAMGFEAIYTRDGRNTAIWFPGVTVSDGNVEVTIEANGHVQVHFIDGYTLPNDLVFTWEENEQASQYLNERFATALGLEKRNRDYPIVENIVENIENILDYHFNTIEFMPTFAPMEEGRLWRINRPMLAQDLLFDKIGYFPIITPDEAIERMLAGEGSHGVDMGQRLPKIEEVVDIRLVYFGHSLGRNLLEVFAPWYEFIFKMPSRDYFQAYFVPAIQTQYLEANPAFSVYPHQ
ncbi:MAG: hypothetical protein FWG63_12875 [Defluviitaleaceae bacterium]|nr:hypothetical protein [Defluviitaleaceae bacterium]